MLRLAILRHADALPLTESGDLERPLSPSGCDMSERMGRYFRQAKLVPDLALVSPSRRTRETFEQLEKGAGENFRVTYLPALYNATTETLLSVVASTSKDVEFLLIIGHNPGFAEFANALAGHGKKAELAKMRTHFPTPCLAIIEFDVKSWKKVLPGEGRLEIFLTRNALAKAIPSE